MADKRWHGWTRPLKSFIETRRTGRSWVELNKWRKENNLRKDVVCHLLAWLEISKEVKFDHKSKKWQASNVRQEKEL